jgi:hypothetical protein
MEPTPQTQLSDEEIDDLLYFARTGDLQALKAFSTEKNTTPSDLLTQAIDPSTGNTLLHFCAANGHIGTSPPSLPPRPLMHRAHQSLNQLKQTHRSVIMAPLQNPYCEPHSRTRQ